jgi:Cys-rich repeat protein
MAFTLRSFFLVGALSFMACQEITTERRTVILADSNGDGYASSGACGVEPAFEGCGDVADDPTVVDDCVIFPNPGDCPLIQWSEERTVVYDENGNIIEETYTVCTQCLDEAGNPLGEEECTTGGGTDPVVCYAVDSGDPTLSCWECTDATGEYYGGCDPIPVYCESDAECPDGQVCELFPTWECDPNVDFCPMPPEFVAGGICAEPVQGCYSDDDCNPGESCHFQPWDCADDMACPAVEQGVCVPDTGSCNSDLDCNPGEVCEWRDVPCDGDVCAAIAESVCVPAEPNCYSDFDCNPGDICQWVDFECPPGALCPDVMVGICVPGNNGCSDETTADGCAANGCEWIPDPGVACVTEPCDFGVCVPPTAGGCDTLTDAESCSASGCEWQIDPASLCLGGPNGEGCPGFCTNPQPGEVCYDDSECGAGEYCHYQEWDCADGMACPAVLTGVCTPIEGGCDTEPAP